MRKRLSWQTLDQLFPTTSEYHESQTAHLLVSISRCVTSNSIRWRLNYLIGLHAQSVPVNRWSRTTFNTNCVCLYIYIVCSNSAHNVSQNEQSYYEAKIATKDYSSRSSGKKRMNICKNPNSPESRWSFSRQELNSHLFRPNHRIEFFWTHKLNVPSHFYQSSYSYYYFSQALYY